MLWTALLKSIYETLRGPIPEPSAQAEAKSRGLLLIADGVGGFGLCGSVLAHLVPDLGLPLSVRVIPWGHGLFRWHADLTNVENHQRQTEIILSELEEFRVQHPDAPMFLLGKSGGSGLIVRALEALPPESVEKVVLLAPALSPQYDLSEALRAVRRELVSFYSPLDLIVLGIGTWLFGTIDRVHGPAAGMVGFRMPEGLSEAGRALYDQKLQQIRWHLAMARGGYCGGHVGIDLPGFSRHYVIPLLTCSDGDLENQETAQTDLSR